MGVHLVPNSIFALFDLIRKEMLISVFSMEMDAVYRAYIANY